ncbi:MAG TPA: hydrogenase maturation nickel metallochaperone HypA [Candidatus Acidoferrum sp.]|nr:hydrogenase maturation nickel metallochaperone HypA [Candidatus Acidoferrum sp.]
MHELSIAINIVEIAEEEAQRRGGLHVTAVHLRLGLLAGVVKDALLSSYGVACEDTPLRGSRLVVEEVPGIVYCPTCAAGRPVRSSEWFCCSECGSIASEIVQGKELEVVSLEVEE